MSLGFLGLGIMGKGMARNLAKKSNGMITVWNQFPKDCEELAREFPNKIDIASSPHQVVQKSDITFSMLSDLNASTCVLDDPSTGALLGISNGKIFVDCSTLSVERMQETSQNVSKRGGEFMEAPVGGSKVPAANGELIFMCGGQKSTFDKLVPYLSMMGKSHYLIGDVGQGAKIKLIVNMMMNVSMAALKESMELCGALNISQSTLYDILQQGVVASPLVVNKAPNIIQNSFPPNFPLKHALKDMRFVCDLASHNNVDLPVAKAARGLFEHSFPRHADEDFSAIASRDN